MLAPLGLEKGKPFKPAEREAKLLTDGAVIGELMSMNISFVNGSQIRITATTRGGHTS
jgi:hypothetical protein